MNRLRWLISVLFVALMAAMWSSLKDKSTETSTKANADQRQADYVAIDLTRMVYDSSGQRTQTLSAQKMTYYESEKRAEFDAPLLILQTKENRGKWRISASEGILIDNTELLLRDKVNAVNLNAQDFINRIISEYFRISLKENTIHSELPVQLFGDGLEIIGSGLTANLNQEKIDLTKHAKTIYQRN